MTAAVNRLLSVQSLLWLALILALAGSLKHLAAVYATIDGDLTFGWLQAIAVDTGIFALAYSIKIRKNAKRSVKPLWAGVIFFTAISVFGNLAYAIMNARTVINDGLPGWMVAAKPVILAGTLPVLVLFLSELLSDDRQHANELAEKAARKQARRSATVTGFVPGDLTALQMANDTRQDKIAERRQEVAALLDNGFAADVIAEQLNVSVRTIRRDLSVITNGNGHQGE